MPIYILSPIDLSHQDWEASTHHDVCRVHAPNEDAAREYANSEFVIAVKTSPDGSPVLSPWKQPSLVDCKEVYPTAEYKEGLIEIPMPDRRYNTIDEVPSVDDLADFNTLTPFGPIDSDKQQVSAEISPETMDKIFKNRTVLAFQCKSMLVCLDQVLDFGEETNQPPIQPFWMESDEKNDQLLDLLGDLRTELKRFNDHIDELKNQDTLSQRVLRGIGQAGLNYLNAFAKSAGTGTGWLFTLALGNFLVGLDLLQPEQLIELITLSNY